MSFLTAFSDRTPYPLHSDEYWMARALALAAFGLGLTRPNPLVGALIVRDGKELGVGWHQRYGQAHAEVNAIAAAREAGFQELSGATMYVTLEPCCHYGKTPPCTEAILAAGITTLVCGMRDPNPLVAGKGLEKLRTSGVLVREGVLSERCVALNQPFCTHIKTRRPWVLMKGAVSVDGKLAAASGDSRWISSEASRKEAHLERLRLGAVLCGIGTVLADNPSLTVRQLPDLLSEHPYQQLAPEIFSSPASIPPQAQPLRIIADTQLRIPEDSTLVLTAADTPLLVACSQSFLAADIQASAKAERLEARRVQILRLNEKDGHIDLTQLLALLGARGVNGLLLEGGSELNAAALKEDLVDALRLYIAPLLLGGSKAPSLLGGTGVATVAAGRKLFNMRCSSLDTDMVLEADLAKEDSCSLA